jgi:hypothetical protein
VDEARSALGLTVRAALPEPAPIFWDVMRRRIAGRLSEAPPARGRRRPLWAAAAVAGAAMAVLATGVGIRPTVEPPHPAAAALPAWSALPPADEDPGMPVLETIAPIVASAPSVECPDVAECVAGLSDDESRALADVLRAKIAQGRTL